MNELKKLLLLFVSCIIFTASFSQDIKWMMGTWKGAGNARKSQFTRTLIVTSINGENFSGTRSKVANDHNNSSVTTSIEGKINRDTFYLKDGAIISKKDPPHAKWLDCTSCIPVNRVELTHDSIVLFSEIIGCAEYCDGKSVYYKLLADLDSADQRSIVATFGTPEQLTAFQPVKKQTAPSKPALDSDAIRKQNEADSLRKIAALEKIRLQHEQDSASAANKKLQQHIDDSLKTEAAINKKRQKQQQDSIVAATKLQQQHIQDSLQNAAALIKRRQQQVADSIAEANLIAKKRQQQVADSLQAAAAIAKKKQQQLQDSINNANAIAQQKQQQLQDSINAAVSLAKKKRAQQIQDSLSTAAKLAKQRQQQIQDSISNANALAKKRQQFVNDSLLTVAKIQRKKQQAIDDSLDALAAIQKQRQQHIQDSVDNVLRTAKIKQQQIDDSIAIAAARKARQDSLKTTAVAGKKPDVSQLMETRDNVLLQSYHITTPDILIELFDNAEIDGDRVTVFHNNNLIVNNQMLTHEPITFKFHASAADRTHEFILIANNLGTIPPNTALMRVTVGKQVYKLSVKTDLKTNAKIDFYYDGD